MVNTKNMTEQEFINWYKENEKDKYEKPSVTTDMVIFTASQKESTNKRKRGDMFLEVMLIERAEHPYKGKWALAGGFMNIDENLETAVQRELQEETGIENVYAEQLYTWSDVERDPRMRIVSASYMALVNKEKLKKAKAGDDASDVKLFKVSVNELNKFVSNEGNYEQKTKIELILKNEELNLELKSILEFKLTTVGTIVKETIDILDSDLSFDHAKIVLYSLLRLQNKIMYTNIAFNLLDDEFTLPDAQQLYETILNRPLNKVQFRQHIEKKVLETGNVRQEGAYRPSKLYKYNPQSSYLIL